MDDTGRAYDTLHYENLAFWMAHPDWIGTLGRLFGIDPAPADNCRVLEIGCARGGHLVPLAELLPDSRFVGIDLAPSQIDAARADGRDLANLRFEAIDVRDVPADWGAFDYIICHGVYSWVPTDARRAILDVCARHLAPNGIAYVSYNALPGWHARGLIRSMLLRAAGSGDPVDRITRAREFLALAATGSAENLPLSPWLQSEIAMLGRLSDRYLYFEHLVPDNDAFHFSDFVADARRAGLDYLTDAEFSSTNGDHLPDAGRLALARTADPIAAQQLLDQLTLRHFRRSLLVRAGTPIASAPIAERVDEMFAWFRDQEAHEIVIDDDTDVAIDADGSLRVTTDDPIGVLTEWEIANGDRAGEKVGDLLARLRTSVPGDDVGPRIRNWILARFAE